VPNKNKHLVYLLSANALSILKSSFMLKTETRIFLLLNFIVFYVNFVC